MEPNTIAKSKETFFVKMYKRPRNITSSFENYLNKSIKEPIRRLQEEGRGSTERGSPYLVQNLSI